MTEPEVNELSVLRDALEASDAWDFSEVDDGLDADILGHIHGAGYSLIPTEELAGLRAALDEAYADRNLVVQAFAQAMADADWPVAWGVDRDEPDWPVIYIDTPEGQVSWHIPKAERLYEPLDRTDSHGPAVWDGHSTETKFARLRAALEAKGTRP